MEINNVYLGRLLANESLTIIQDNVDTAYFKLKERVLILPYWADGTSQKVIDLMLGHEVGHALYSPQSLFTAQAARFLPSFLVNIVEDIRIEKLIKNRYPGLIQDFEIGYKEMYEKDFFGTADIQNLGDLDFINRLNIKSKVGDAINIPFMVDEFNDYKMSHSLSGIKSVYEYSQYLFDKYIKNNPKNSSCTDGGGISGKGTDGGDIDSKGMGDSYTYEAMAKKLKSLSARANGVSVIEAIPYDIIDKVMVPDQKILSARRMLLDKNMQRAGFNKSFSSIVNKNKSLLNALHTRFEMKKAARRLLKTGIHKTGVLNADKLFSYKYSDDIFSVTEVVSKQKNHGIVVLVDYSGSMQGSLPELFDKVMLLILFLEKQKIPFEIYGFSSKYHEYSTIKRSIKTDLNLVPVYKSSWSMNDKKMLHHSFSMLAEKGTPFNLTQYEHLGTTPLNEAIVVNYMDIIPKFLNRHKIDLFTFITITDGGSNHNLKVGHKDSYIDVGGNLIQAKSTTDLTEKILDLVKKKYQATIVNFFIAGSRNVNNNVIHNSDGYDLKYFFKPADPRDGDTFVKRFIDIINTREGE